VEAWIDGDPEPPKRPRLRLLAGAAGAAIALAAVGATGGWLLAGSDRSSRGSGDRSPTPPASYLSPSSTGSTPSPTGSTPSPTESATPIPTESATPIPGEFPLPDVTGADFIAARRQLRELRLGVQVDFGGEGDGHSVERTSPRAGQTVRAGITVKLHVRGDPPTLQVPSLLGIRCADAGRDAADRGLVPRYDPQKAGVVVKQDPQPYEEARWNDRIKLDCKAEAPATY
jgi:hypothetical protein